VSAVSLVAAAEAAGVADIASQNRVAVATTHAAVELLLGLIAGPGSRRPARASDFRSSFSERWIAGMTRCTTRSMRSGSMICSG
jgi:hypothetical protein